MVPDGTSIVLACFWLLLWGGIFLAMIIGSRRGMPTDEEGRRRLIEDTRRQGVWESVDDAFRDD